ncbi:MAG: hypothetical protein IPP46_04375 [Bacteroidetes bacterium]|nr:hypothetical protein [Bacteroidota bacterium]
MENQKSNALPHWGVAYYHYNPIAILNDQEVELNPLGTEGQYIEGGGNPKPYKLYSLSFPLGVGVEFRLTNAFAARIEIINHFTFADYFDDLSGVYADSLQLSATTNGALAVEMASNLADGYPRTGASRGDPNDNDTYMFAGVKLYTLLFLVTMATAAVAEEVTNPVSRAASEKEKANCPAFD